MENIIEIRNLSKSFNDVKAVQDLSFRVKKGELFAFLGVNGAGKSTTISIMCGHLRKDSGSVKINDFDLDKNADSIKQKLGVVYQNSVLDKALTVKDNLKVKAALYQIRGNNFKKRLDELAKLLEFEEILNRPVGKLSGGQIRRIDIARAIIHEPEILILDEPTTGLDPQTRKMLWRVISDMQNQSGLTVFLTTHYMEEATEADYVVILDHGKIVGEGTPLELKNAYTGDFVLLYNVSEEQVKKLELKYKIINDGYQIEIPNTEKATELIVKHPEIFVDYEIIKGKMDDVFINVTGKKIGVE